MGFFTGAVSGGGDVTELQTILGVEADGLFGSQTKQALIDLQTMLGIDADGIYGSQTAAAIRAIRDTQ